VSEGVRLASIDAIAVGEGVKIDRSVAGTADDIALLRDDDGQVYALDDTCTHETASLSDGWVEDGFVECPMHSSKFCLRNGEVSGLPATKDACPHRVEVRDGEIYIFPGEAP